MPMGAVTSPAEYGYPQNNNQKIRYGKKSAERNLALAIDVLTPLCSLRGMLIFDMAMVAKVNTFGNGAKNYFWSRPSNSGLYDISCVFNSAVSTYR